VCWFGVGVRGRYGGDASGQCFVLVLSWARTREPFSATCSSCVEDNDKVECDMDNEVCYYLLAAEI
jgi:hypothetical protein